MEAERGTLKKKIFFTEAAFQSRFSKDVALKDCLQTFFVKTGSTACIFGSSHPEVFCKKILNILAKSLIRTCGVHFVVKLQAVVCIYSNNKLFYKCFSGFIQSISQFYNLHVPLLENSWLVLIRFFGNPTFQTLYKNLMFSLACFFGLISVILKSFIFKFSSSENKLKF